MVKEFKLFKNNKKTKIQIKKNLENFKNELYYNFSYFAKKKGKSSGDNENDKEKIEINPNEKEIKSNKSNFNYI